MLRRAVTVSVVAVAAVGLTGCGNSTTVAAKRPHTGTATASAGAGGVQTVTVTTGNDFRFHPSTIVVHPGTVRIVLTNTAAVGSGPPHNLKVSGLPGQTTDVFAGQSAQWEFTTPAPGSYQFVCTLHVAQGQTGTLIVER